MEVGQVANTQRSLEGEAQPKQIFKGPKRRSS